MRDMSCECRGRILVVDQDDWCREFLSSVFKLCGYEEFKVVSTAAEALKALEETAFDLIIADLKLAEQQAFLNDSRNRDPNIRFILMVHQHGPSQPVHYHYMEEVDVVFKPLSLDDMVRKIRHAIHQKHLRRMEDEIRRLKQEALRLLF